MGKRYEIRRIKGVDHKHCGGPLHPDGGAWVPVKDFTKRGDNKGRLRGNCRACEHYWRYRKPPQHSPNIGYVPFQRFLFAVRELESRVGRYEAARRVGVGKTTWYRWVSGDQEKIQKRNAAKLMKTLQEVRRQKIVRHRRSIRRGSYLRGEAEKRPERPEHYYRQTGDEPELKRNRELKREQRSKKAA